MAKKHELTPEIKAKVDEIIKEHGVRELSPEELGGVAGGTDSVLQGGDFTSHEEIDRFCDMIDTIINTLGLDIAIEVAVAYLPGYSKVEENMDLGGSQMLGKYLHEEFDRRG